MRQLPTTGEPVWDLQFDENGKLAATDFLAEIAHAGVSDLFAFTSPTLSSNGARMFRPVEESG